MYKLKFNLICFIQIIKNCNPKNREVVKKELAPDITLKIKK